MTLWLICFTRLTFTQRWRAQPSKPRAPGHAHHRDPPPGNRHAPQLPGGASSQQNTRPCWLASPDQSEARSHPQEVQELQQIFEESK